MDTRDSGGVISMLPASWEGIRYLDGRVGIWRKKVADREGKELLKEIL
ncbi:hypothetical protein EVAR_101578_1, partial [Eumeta japonica]